MLKRPRIKLFLSDRTNYSNHFRKPFLMIYDMEDLDTHREVIILELSETPNSA